MKQRILPFLILSAFIGVVIKAFFVYFPDFIYPKICPIIKPRDYCGSLPDLYPSIQWSTKEADIIDFGKPRIDNGYRIKSVVLNAYPTKFLNYYKRELEARWWARTSKNNNEETKGIAEFYTYDYGNRHVNIFAYRSTQNFLEYFAVIEYN